MAAIVRLLMVRPQQAEERSSDTFAGCHYFLHAPCSLPLDQPRWTDGGRVIKIPPMAKPSKPSSLVDTRVVYCGDNLLLLAKPDIQFLRSGGMNIVQPLSKQGIDWVQSHLAYEPWQVVGQTAIAVDHCVVDTLRQNAIRYHHIKVFR